MEFLFKLFLCLTRMEKKRVALRDDYEFCFLPTPPSQKNVILEILGQIIKKVK
jgi:hypothetical protein